MTNPQQFQSGAPAVTLTGIERVNLDSGGSITSTTTTGAIAGLASGSNLTSTAITTAGAGTLTAAALVGGVIARTGPVAAYTDTTATAAQIVTALGAFTSGQQFRVTIKNATAFQETLAAGTGVTLPPTVIIGPMQEGQYWGVVGGTSASPTVTFSHILTSSIALSQGVTTPLAGALSTVGAGTITAAMVAGSVVVRSGSQTNTAFTDTTATADLIIAADPGFVGKIGASKLVWYQNTTNANATITGGTGVTVSGITVVPANSTALYLLTYTAASTMTMVGLQVTHPSAPNGTFTANGATAVTITDSRITANSTVTMGLKTVGGTPAGQPFMFAVTAGTSFQIKSVAGDTSVYNYTILN